MSQFSPLEYEARTSELARHPASRAGRPVRRQANPARRVVARALHRVADAVDGRRLATPATR